MPSSLSGHRAPKKWNKVVIRVDPCMSEALTAYLLPLTGSGLEVSAAENMRGTSKEATIAGEKITAYLPVASRGDAMKAVAKQTKGVEEFLVSLSHIFPDCLPPILKNELIREEDWGKKWKRFFTAFQVTPSLIIKPSWEEAAEKRGKNQHVLVLDPGLAFGTGHHASTQLALLLLEQLFQESKDPLTSVLDIGTGSGILAMACSLFGAREVLAIDNDPDAVETAQQNILKNRLNESVSVSNCDAALLKPDFHIVVANITHDILAELAAQITKLLLPGGFLVLSGILNGEQEQSIRKTYAEQGLQYLKSLSKDEWAALLFQKKAV